MLKDEVRLKIKAGKGGHGAVKYGQGSPPHPSGGEGGDGGNIYLEGTRNYYDLNHIAFDKIFEAEDGQVGGPDRKRGKNGNDLTIKLPLITDVYDENDNLVASIKKEGEKILFLKGGRGGLGNYYFRRGFEGRFDKANPGKDGEQIFATLRLKLVADVIFIGYPNAGKSSLLNALTKARAKVGNYPFTTLSPNLGRLPGLTLMDLPGLIEGTSKGKGLGTNFLKHTENSRLVAHTISLGSENILEDYKLIRNELKEMSQDLYNMPEIIILTKSDMFDEKYINNKIQELKNLDKEIVVCSAFAKTGLEEVEKRFRGFLSH